MSDEASPSPGPRPDPARLLAKARVATVVISLDGTLSYASESAGTLLGTPAGALVGTSVARWLAPDDLPRAVSSLTAIAASPAAQNFPMVFRLRRADGREVEVDVLARDLVADPEVRGVLLNLVAADDRTRYVEPIRALAAGLDHPAVLRLVAAGVGRGGHSLRPAAVVALSGGGVEVHPVRMDPDLASALAVLVAGISPAAERIRALAPRERCSFHRDELPLPLPHVLAADQRAGLRVGAVGCDGSLAGLLVAAEPDGAWFDGEWTPSMQHHWDDLLDLATVAFERHRTQSRLLHSATHDALTGLANRAHFHDRLARLGRRHDLSVLYLDLDDFKEINDHSGHARGDEVLAEIGRRLRDAVRAVDVVGRLGGDEFAVAVVDTPAATVVELAERLLVSISAPLPPACGGGTVGASVGVAHRRQGEPVDELLARADHAMLAVKRSPVKGWLGAG